jgi:prolipoprotein diacylglyceryl transferase
MTELLYITWAPDPEIFAIESFSVRWYGVLFALGFFIGYFIVKDMFKREGIPLKLLDNLATYLVLGTIVGARLGHCLFYEPEYYLSNPVEILKVWEGGLASHGGTIGVILALYLFARRYKLGFLWLLDRIAVPTALAAFFIRMGNLMNSEIFGNVTDMPWGFYFVKATPSYLGEDPRHPTQIYEGLAYLFTFGLLMWLYYKRRSKLKDGFYVGLFLILVFLSRFFIEFVKEPQVAFESTMTLNMGQWLSIPFVVAGVLLMVFSYKKGPHPGKPERMKAGKPVSSSSKPEQKSSKPPKQKSKK